MTETNSVAKERVTEIVSNVVVKLFEKALTEKNFNKFANDTDLASINFNLKEGEFSYNDAFQLFEQIVKIDIGYNSITKDGIDKIWLNELGNLQDAISSRLDSYLNDVIEHCKNDNEKVLNMFKMESFAMKFIGIVPPEKNPIGYSINMLEKYNTQFTNLKEKLGEEEFIKKRSNVLAGLDNFKVNDIKADTIVNTLENSPANLKILKNQEEELNSEIGRALREKADTSEKEKNIKKIRSEIEIEKGKTNLFLSQLNFINRNIEDITKLMFSDVVEKKNLNLENLETKQYKEQLLIDETLGDLYLMGQKWQEVFEKIKDLEEIGKDFKTKLEQSCKGWGENFVKNGAKIIDEFYEKEPNNNREKMIETMSKVSIAIDSLVNKSKIRETLGSSYMENFLEPNSRKFYEENISKITNKKAELLNNITNKKGNFSSRIKSTTNSIKEKILSMGRKSNIERQNERQQQHEAETIGIG